MSVGCSGLLDFYADLGSLGQGSFCSYDPIARASIWQGNSADLYLHLFIGGIAVDDLSTATSGTFQALGHRDNSVGVEVLYPGDPRFIIDDPETGIVHIHLNANDTETMIGEYDLAVEFTWVDKKLEWTFSKTLNVMRDQILFPNCP